MAIDVYSRQFERIEDQKAELLESLSDWSAAQLHFQPGAGEWSAVEVLDHLIKTEMGILLVAKKTIGHPHRISPADRIRVFFLLRLFRSERRMKVPASVPEILPGTNLELSSLVHRWERSRTHWNAFLASEDAKRVRGGLFKHPVGGWMSLPQILAFFSVHLIHHNYQFRRLQASARHLR